MKDMFSGPNIRSSEEMVTMAKSREELLSKLAPYRNRLVEQQVLKDIDFGLVRTILTEEFKSGVTLESRGTRLPQIPTQEDILFVTPEGLQVIGAPTNIDMTYQPATGLIIVNVKNIASAMLNSRSLSPRSRFLEILFHEFNHVLSSQSSRKENPGEIIQVGVQELLVSGDNIIGTRFEFINEAMNNLRGRQLAARYLRSSPLDQRSRKDAEVLDDLYLNTDADPVRVLGAVVLKVMAERIAAHTGMEMDTVWKSFWHAGLNGLQLSSKDVRQSLNLDEIFGPEFTKSLTNFSPQDAIQFLVKEGVVERDPKFRELLHRSFGIRVEARK